MGEIKGAWQLDNDQCKFGYFGEGFQSLDVVNSYALHFVASFLFEGGDSASIPVKDNLWRTLQFPWFMIYVRGLVKVDKFNIKLNDDQNCTNRFEFVVNRQAVGNFSDKAGLVNKLRGEGSICLHICSPYISGGRYVARNGTLVSPALLKMEISYVMLVK